MDYILKFDNGSEAYLGNSFSGQELMHYGVLGMKWGIWNAETRARRSGSKFHLTTEQKTRYKEIAKTALKMTAVSVAIVGGKMLVRAAIGAAVESVSGTSASSPTHGAERLQEIASTRPNEYAHVVSNVMQGHTSHSTPGNWANYGYPSEFGPKPHAHVSSSTVHTGEGIVNQLLAANIPDSLKSSR